MDNNTNQHEYPETNDASIFAFSDIRTYIPTLTNMLKRSFNDTSYFWASELLVAVSLGVLGISIIYLKVTEPLEQTITDQNVKRLVDSITNDVCDVVGPNTIKQNQSAIQQRLTLSPAQQQSLSVADTQIQNNNAALQDELMIAVSCIVGVGLILVLVLYYLDPVTSPEAPKSTRYLHMIGENIVLTVCVAIVYVAFQYAIPLNFIAADTNMVKSDAIAASLEYADIKVV